MRTTKRLKKHRKRRTLKRVLHVGGNIPIKLFDLDLHPSVIEDIKSVLNTIYPNKFDLTIWSISGYDNQYGRSTKEIKHINDKTWKNINMDMIQQFQNEYDSELKKYDGFVVTHSPVFAMIYEKYNKPIIVVNSCRFNQPFCWNKDNTMLKLFTDALKRMQNNKQLVIISNNKADQSYLKRTADINSEYIPSLCMYTNEKYNPIKNNFVYFENRYTKDNMEKFKSLNTKNLIVNRPKNYTFKDLFEYKGIIHLPYDISTMGLFEQYFAGIPLFFPEKNFYKKCIEDNVAQFIVRYDTWTHLGGDILIPSSDEIDLWLKDADYYNFKYINYYTSYQDCIDKIKSFTDENKDERLNHIETVKKESLDKWKQIVNNIFKIQSGGNLEIKYPPKEINDYIRHVIYINLDARTDRNESIQKQLKIFDKNKITRMSAVNNPENPIIGCATSHLNAIKMARDNKYSNVLILEDDAVWENVKKGYSSFKNLIEKQYDVIMLGGTYKNYNKNTYKINSAQSAASYLINSSYYDKIINGIQFALDDPNSDKNVDVMYINMQKQANWFIVIPALMIQVKSISNIQKYEVDYRNLFYNSGFNPENTHNNSKMHGGQQNLDVIPICIYSHSSFEDVLEIQLNYMSKIPNISKQKIYLFIDKAYTKETNLKYQTILYDNILLYNKRLAKCISEVLEPYFILTHENDILVDYDPNTILEIKKAMVNNGIDSTNLQHYTNCEDHIKINNNLSISIATRFYVQPRIWKKTSALNLFNLNNNKNYRNIEDVSIQTYVSLNQKTYNVCSKIKIQSLRGHLVIPEYKYLHITTKEKFIENKQKIDKNIEVIYNEIYNTYIKKSLRGTIEW